MGEKAMKASEIKKVAVLGGCGMIGSGWTTNFLWRGLPVHVYDVSDDCLKTARGRIRGNLEYLVNKGLLNQEKMNVALSLARYTTNMEEAVRDVSFIQEAAPEKYDVKRALIAEVDRYAPSDAVFASSTSGLLITEIAKESMHPERCLGAHPYNPPHLIPLVEISKGEKTSQKAVTLAYDFYRLLGKEPIILKKEALGFIANRLSVALYREAIDLVLKGVCSVEDIDKAVCFGPGLRYALMGPNLIYHLAGGPFGIKGVMQHIGPSVEMWWADMAVWTKVPVAWPDMAQEGVLKEMSNRSEAQGKTADEIARWRDDGILALLKFHNKV
jgi:3-hydroxyacyl-CoA dehydrogenase